MNSITKAETVQEQKTKSVFYTAYNCIAMKIPVDPKWRNGTGYFSRAVDMVKLKPGNFAKAFCEDSRRKMILIGTIFGTVVVFERYADGNDNVFVSNKPSVLQKFRLSFLPEGRIGEWQMCEILGSWFNDYRGKNNISDHLNMMSEAFLEKATKHVSHKKFRQ